MEGSVAGGDPVTPDPITADPRDEIRRGRLMFAGMAAATFVLLIGLGLGMTFFSDEWAFIESRSLRDSGTWLLPHNEHWSTLPVLLYRAMVELIGIGSYVPYQTVVVTLHIVVVTLTYLVLERLSGPTIALAGSAILLVFGSGFENLYWGFQTGFLGSLAFGLAAIVLTDLGPSRRRAAGVAALLLASLASSGIGLVMSIAVGIVWLLDRPWRRCVPVLIAPAASYLTWLVLIGRDGIKTFRDPFSAEALLDINPSILQGFANAFGSVVGMALVGLVAAALLITRAARRSDREGIHPLALAAIATIAILYALIGAARGGLFDGVIDYTRYTYVAGVLALVAMSALLGPFRLPGAGRTRLFAVGGLMSWLALSLVLNVALLLHGREVFLARADMTRALVTVALEPLPDGVDEDRSLILVPSPGSVRRIAESHGDPRADSLVPWAVRPIPQEILAEARRRLMEGVSMPIPPVQP
jgi:hypothetical protein